MEVLPDRGEIRMLDDFDIETFDENRYLFANPDAALAIIKKKFKSVFKY